MPSDKDAIRKEVLAKRKAISPDERTAMSTDLYEQLSAYPPYQKGMLIGMYSAKSDEVDTTIIIDKAIAEGKKIALPKVEGDQLTYYVINSRDELVKGKFGILEPPEGSIEMETFALDLIVCPGVAFDMDGHRIGYGGGFFDKTINGYMGETVSLAFPCQIVDKIEPDPWDSSMKKIIVAKG